MEGDWGLMTKFIANFEFGANLTHEQAQEWIATVREQLPDGAEGSVKTVPLVLSIEDVTEEHAGNIVTVRGLFALIKKGDKKAAKAMANSMVQATNLTGTLEHVFETGNTSGLGRTLVVDGKAYAVPSYSLVELGEW
jgi:hypothetical protein